MSEREPSGAHMPVGTGPEVTKDGAFERGSGSDVVDRVRHLAEHKPEHVVVSILRAGHQLEAPLESDDVGCGGQISSQLLVQKPGGARHDPVVKIWRMAGEEHLRSPERLLARRRRQWPRLWDVHA